MDEKSRGPVSPVFYEEFGLANVAIPERRLFAAVIQRAILDYLSTSSYLRRTARIFLFEDDPAKSPLRLYAELLFNDPDVFIERLRKEVRGGHLRPKQVACANC